jgi:predicted nucleic acid-binding protein
MPAASFFVSSPSLVPLTTHNFRAGFMSANLIQFHSGADNVASVTPTITELAMNIGERYQISHWDSLIVAAALATGCETLYSEDMQDGQVFEGRLTVRNPF